MLVSSTHSIAAVAGSTGERVMNGGSRSHGYLLQSSRAGADQFLSDFVEQHCIGNAIGVRNLDLHGSVAREGMYSGHASEHL